MNKPALFVGAVVVGFLAFAPPASAHVSVEPSTAEPGSNVDITFRMPNEETNLNTTSLEVDIPTDSPIASVLIEPQTGWTYTVENTKLATPITIDNKPIDQVISKITWTASNGGIKPGEFVAFNLAVGPLPMDTPQINFKALQTYSDGQVVRWIDLASPGQTALNHPAPVLKLTTASKPAGATPAAITTKQKTSGVAIAALVIGMVALALSLAILIVVVLKFAIKPPA